MADKPLQLLKQRVDAKTREAKALRIKRDTAALELDRGQRLLAELERWELASGSPEAAKNIEQLVSRCAEVAQNIDAARVRLATLQHERSSREQSLSGLTDLEHNMKLHDVAGKFGAWPVQRERALIKVDEVIAREATTTNRWKPKSSTPNYSLRVQIALWEEDLDAAWSAAHEGACDRSLLITLAGKLESARPDDAVNLYRRVVQPIVEQTNNTASDDAIKLIRTVGALMKTQKQAAQFCNYLTELRVQFKLTRNFIKLLDGVVRSTVGAKSVL